MMSQRPSLVAALMASVLLCAVFMPCCLWLSAPHHAARDIVHVDVDEAGVGELRPNGVTGPSNIQGRVSNDVIERRTQALRANRKLQEAGGSERRMDEMEEAGDSVAASIGVYWLDLSSATARQSSTSSYRAAHLSIDGNAGTYAHTNRQADPWWEVQLGIRAKITAVEMLLQHNGGSYQAAPLLISVDGVMTCATVSVLQTGTRMKVPCQKPTFGSTVRISTVRQSVHLVLYEVRIEEEPSGRNEVKPDDLNGIICPFLRALIKEKILQGCVHMREALLRATLDAGPRDEDFNKRAAAHVEENFKNIPSGIQDICKMEGAPNEHFNSTGINDCKTEFGSCDPARGSSPASCPNNSTVTPCGVPNARKFEEFFARLDGNTDSYLSITELQNGVGQLSIVDANPVGSGTIVGSFGLLIEVFGERGMIHKANLAKVVLQGMFPSGYVFGKLPPSTNSSKTV